MSKQQLILIRGIPGSGKSTLAERIEITRGSVDFMFEADMYFTDGLGRYEFDAKELSSAHAWCFSNTAKALKLGYPVIVANTFTKKWEMKKYIDLANSLGVELIVIRCTGNYGSIHNVPAEKIKQMQDRFEDYEGEIIYDN